MSDPLHQPPFQQPNNFSGPYNSPPKRKRLGCMGWGCIVMFVATGIMLVVLGVSAYLLVNSLKNFTGSDKLVETPVYEGTPDEKAAVQQKITTLRQTFGKGQATTETFTADEINIMIASSPPDMHLEHHVYVTINDNLVSAQAAIPLGAFLSILGNATVQGTVVFVPSIQDGRVNMDFKSIKIKDQQWNDETIKAFSQSFNDKFNEQLATDPKSAEFLSHIKTITIENNAVTITTQ